MSQERYVRSADMRLLELQRSALGLAPRVVNSAKYTDLGPLGEGALQEADVALSQGTVLIATLDVRPRTGILVGSVLTASLSIANDGDVAGRGLRIGLALPFGARAIPATLVVDGALAPDSSSEDLFGNGLDLGVIDAGRRRTLVVKFTVEDGEDDLLFSPQLVAPAAAVLGLRALRLRRDGKAQPQREAKPPADRIRPVPPNAKPVRERGRARPTTPTSDAASAPAASPPAPSAAPTADPPVNLRASETHANGARTTPPADGPAVSPRVTVHDGRVAVNVHVDWESGPVYSVAELTAAQKIASVRSDDGRVKLEGRGGPLLTVELDAKRLATLQRLFGGRSLGMIAHYLLLNALAVQQPLSGHAGDDAIAAFLTAQEQLLSRALISHRLGKAISPDAVGAPLPPFPPKTAACNETRLVARPPTGAVLLARAFGANDMVYLERMIANPASAAFLRASQLFVGLCANDIVIAPTRERHAVVSALTSYAAAAAAEIGRIFLRAKLGTPELFKATDPSFDEAARSVLAALAGSVA